MMKALLPLFMVAALAGCSASSGGTGEPAPLPPKRAPLAEACDAAAVQDWVGQHYQEAQDERLKAESGAKTLRVLRPGGVATMDLRLDRLNVRLDDADTIVELGCG
ncbi:hypothetical protein KUV41_12430 [Halomonas sp. DP8Y7-1]|nr:hypothetical protein [Halomonas litopenaei]MBY5969991.1 hypothetical protein [Halomonas denitrificans]MBY6030161.1 hypothetical protein [Halomonas sp. DP8Y7-1]